MTSKVAIRPVQWQEGYGLTGVVLHLNLQQCQKLSNLYHALNNTSVKTQVEEEIGGFLQIFKDINVPEQNLWNNMVEKIEPEEPPRPYQPKVYDEDR